MTIPDNPRAVYQLRIALRAIRPPIWRRVQVPVTMTLARLHRVFQVAMGWTDSHLHEFVIRGRRFGRSGADEWDADVASERSARLGDVVGGPGSRFTYLYDFGDGWEHEVRVEKALPAEPGAQYPRCLAGARACPPEDCGSYPGYTELLEALADPSHEQHDELLEWVGGAYDPETFDLDAVNRRLRRFRGA